MFNILLILIFLRPFISQLLFPLYDIYYSLVFCVVCLIWLSYKKQLSLQFPSRYPVLFFLFALWLSCILSVNPLNSIKSIYKYITYLIAFYAALKTTETEKRRIILTLFFSAALTGIIGIYQHFFGFHPIFDFLVKLRPDGFDFAKKYLEQKRIFSVFVTPTVFAGYIIIIIPIALGYLYEKKQGFLYQPLTYLIAVLSICLLLTKSVGAFLGLAVGLMVFFMLSESLNKKILLPILGVFTILFFTIIIFRNYLRPEALPEFSTTIIQRKMFWRDTWEIIKKYPLRGIGLGNFAIPGTKFAHNSYLQIWAEMGILAIASYLRIIFTSLNKGFLRLKIMKLRGFAGTGLLNGLLAASCAFLVHNLVDFTFFTPEVALLSWLMLGLTLSF